LQTDPKTNERLRTLLEQIIRLTDDGTIRWERQLDSAHRYARWNGNLLILGPTDAPSSDAPRYLFITPFDSPDCIEISSTQAELGSLVRELSERVERATADGPQTDPFAINESLLSRLTS
jgi:hypothetical protein